LAFSSKQKAPAKKYYINTYSINLVYTKERRNHKEKGGMKKELYSAAFLLRANFMHCFVNLKRRC
jgi:hypothetical protein